MAGSKKVSVSLPLDVLEQVDFVASRFRMTRSAFISSLLSDTMPSIMKVAQCIPPEGQECDGETVKRFRGASAELISDSMKILRSGESGDLLDIDSSDV